MSTQTITFRTAAQAAIFEHEVKGQLSDGHWENDPRSCWQDWCRTDPIVGEHVGTNFSPRRSAYGLDNPTLTKVVGDRMRLYAVLANLGHSLEDIDTLEHAFEFCGCEPAEVPTHGGKYWEGVRAQLESLDLPALHKAVADGLTVYRKKELLADLREMKVAMRTRIFDVTEPMKKIQAERANDEIAVEDLGPSTISTADMEYRTIEEEAERQQTTPLEYALEDATRTVELTKEQLTRQAINLSNDMRQLADKVEKDRGTVNSLGEVQAMGSTIDRLCAVLAEQKRQLETIRTLCLREEG